MRHHGIQPAGARHTRDFEDLVAFLAQQMSRRPAARAASSATHSQTMPTVRQAIRINAATALFEGLTANYASWSSTRA